MNLFKNNKTICNAFIPYKNNKLNNDSVVNKQSFSNKKDIVNENKISLVEKLKNNNNNKILELTCHKNSRITEGQIKIKKKNSDVKLLLKPPSNYSLKSEQKTENVMNNKDSFIACLNELKTKGWYWGPMGWEDAESLLSVKPAGSFLVRDSSNDRYILSLSFKADDHMIHHTRIEHYKGMFSFTSQPISLAASTIVKFVEQLIFNSQEGLFSYFLRPTAPGQPPILIRLLNPISRFSEMTSLQHVCRFVILNHVRRDHVDCLPLPSSIKTYLKQNQYYVENI